MYLRVPSTWLNFENKISKPPDKNPGIVIIWGIMKILNFSTCGFENLFTELRTIYFKYRHWTLLSLCTPCTTFTLRRSIMNGTPGVRVSQNITCMKPVSQAFARGRCMWSIIPCLRYYSRIYAEGEEIPGSEGALHKIEILNDDGTSTFLDWSGSSRDSAAPPLSRMPCRALEVWITDIRALIGC